MEIRASGHSLFVMTDIMTQMSLEWEGELLPQSMLGTDHTVDITIHSPGQGAMFAPLYGKHVLITHSFHHSMTDLSSMICRIPVRDIQFNSTTTTPPPQTSKRPSKPSHIGEVAIAVIGTVAAIVFVAAIIVIIWYRRRRTGDLNIREYTAPSSEAMETGSGILVTPFISNRLRINNRHSMPRTERQQPQSGLVPASGTVSVHDPFPSPELSGQYSHSSPVVPIGLSDKELAQMRAEILRSQPAAGQAPEALDASGSQLPSIPIGLSAKELARMRAEALQSRPAVTSPVLDESRPRSQPPRPPASPVVATERSAATSAPLIFRTIQSQFDLVWREIQQLQVRAERAGPAGSEAPPSYAEREASHRSGGMRS